MTGTLLNALAILIGGVIGLLFGARLPERVQRTIVAGLGLFCAAIGIQMFLKTQNSLIVLGSILFGGLLGEWWRIEDRLKDLGGFLEARVQKRHPAPPAEPAPATPTPVAETPFIRGFLTASLVFCVGPIAILGSIQDGLSGDYQLLAVKSIMDGFASIAFAASLGVGVLFSILPVLVYQGGLSLAAAQVQSLITTPMMNEMTAAGGLLLIGIAVSSLLELKQIRVGNFVPALIIAPLIVAILALLGYQL
jgi:uncharacterized membrane protein YqgA involved in biofilm formation